MGAADAVTLFLTVVLLLFGGCLCWQLAIAEPGFHEPRELKHHPSAEVLKFMREHLIRAKERRVESES